MKTGFSLHLYKSSTEGLDITSLVESVKWKGRKNSAARSITVKLLDDDGYQHARAGIDVEKGHHCIWYENGEEIFRGIIMTSTDTQKKVTTFTAYDNGIYLSNNKDTFTYTNKTASEVFVDVCNRFGLPIGTVDACKYRIPELTKSKATGFDVIADALSLDYENTGIRHYVMSSGGKLSLITRRKNILQWVLEAGQNIINYSYTKSIEDIKTRIKLLSDEDTVLAERRNTDLERKIGIFQDIDTPDETLNQAQIEELCKTMLQEKSTPSRTITLDAIGNSSIISGVGVYIIIPHLSLSGTFYVDDDTHTITENSHRISVKLNAAGDIGIDDEPASGTTAAPTVTHKVGDIVQFNGGYHYVSSVAAKPTGPQCKPGPAKITLYAKGAKHPWHLIHTNSQSRVYGWVDEGTFS